jgi:hypothetical protein
VAVSKARCGSHQAVGVVDSVEEVREETEVMGHNVIQCKRTDNLLSRSEKSRNDVCDKRYDNRVAL